jgi:hypothetical protein
MSWLITSTQKTDPDALAYLAEVERADGQALESGLRNAVIAFVTGCKADGIWSAIKASCILAGARTLTGALVPLVGAAPTNFNFVSGDYNRKTGLRASNTGDGVGTKYLNSNRSHAADPQDSFHVSAFASTIGAFAIVGVGSSTGRTSLGEVGIRIRSDGVDTTGGIVSANTFTGGSRSSSTTVTRRVNGTTQAITRTSEAPALGNVFVLARNNNGTPDLFGDHRLAFYSIGESLDLALLDTRVTTLIQAIGAAI